MANQKPWTIYEAAILLDGFLQFSEGTVSRKQAISNVSTKLRQIAINQGEIIDEIYRNFNGITFQMASLESAYRGHTVMKPPTRLFAEIVSIYKTDQTRYQKILEDAMAMFSNGKANNAEHYVTWLSSKVNSDSLSEFYLLYDDIENYMRKSKILSAPLLETTDLATIQKVQRTIEQSKLFRITRKNKLYMCGLAMRYYAQFLSENMLDAKSNATIPEKETSIPGRPTDDIEILPATEESLKDCGKTEESPQVLSIEERVRAELKAECELNSYGTTITYMQTKLGPIEHALVKAILTKAEWAKFQFGKWHYVEVNALPAPAPDEKKQTVSPDTLIVDFTKLPDLSYTTPLCVSYFGETKAGFASWANMYLALVAWLYEDYDHILKVGMSFTQNGSGRIDLGTRQMSLQMRNPKRVPLENTELYLECNISATYIGAKIKRLLDICNVDYENVIIEYQREKASKPIEPVPTKPKRETVESALAIWLRDVAKMSESSCRGYISALRTAERFAEEHNYSSTELLSIHRETAKAAANELLADPVFMIVNVDQHNRFSAAIRKLLEFHGFSADQMIGRPKDKTNDEDSPFEPTMDKSPFITVLKEKFVRGFRLGSSLDMKKFKRFYEAIHEEALELEDDEIEQTIRACGIVHEGKIYLPEIMISEESKEKILRYIMDSFSEGKTTIYYEALFRLFSDDFLGYYIYDADMLKAYLSHINEGKYHISKSYLSKDGESVSDPYDEVKSYLKNCVAPLDSDELCQILSHIPAAKVKHVLGTYSEFVNNGKSAYFHVSIVHFYDEDMESIRDIISTAIRDNGFISGNELFAAIKSLRPHIVENNAAISSLGIRDTLKYHLGQEFSFNGNIISDMRKKLMMADVFADFAKKRSSFTLAELSTLASELETGIYFESVYEYAFRISLDEFTSKSNAKFFVEQTDKVLDRFCPGTYISIKNISDFGIFPDAGFQWNSFLLEQYVHSFSKKYRLIHVGFNQRACVGAIVRRSTGIDAFDDFAVDVLANSGIELTKANALTYLVEEGYLARRNYTGIEPLLIQANAQRNIKGKK